MFRSKNSNRLKAPIEVSLLLAIASCQPRAFNQHLAVVDAKTSQTLPTGENFYDGADSWPLLPTNQDRNFTCPVRFKNSDVINQDTGTAYLPASDGNPQTWRNQISFNWTALNTILADIASPDELKVTVIDIRRVLGVPHFRYLSNGTQDDFFSPGSANKFMAFAALGARLRGESRGKIGLDAVTDDTRHTGRVPLGDLVSFATTQAETFWNPTLYKNQIFPFTSNNVASWAKRRAGQAAATQLLQMGWLGFRNLYLYSDYGNNDSALDGKFYANNTSVSISESSNSPDIDTGKADDRVSTLASAEFLKRLVLHREDVREALPHLSYTDVQNILYGSHPQQSRYFKNTFSGMAHAPSTYVQRALGLSSVSRVDDSYLVDNSESAIASRGQWRVFTNAGASQKLIGRYLRNDFALNAYVCLPAYDSAGKLNSTGREFVISAYLMADQSRDNSTSDSLLQSATHAIAEGLKNGTIH